MSEYFSRLTSHLKDTLTQNKTNELGCVYDLSRRYRVASIILQ